MRWHVAMRVSDLYVHIVNISANVLEHIICSFAELSFPSLLYIIIVAIQNYVCGLVPFNIVYYIWDCGVGIEFSNVYEEQYVTCSALVIQHLCQNIN